MNNLTKLVLYPTLYIAGMYGIGSLIASNSYCGIEYDLPNSYNKCLVEIYNIKNKTTNTNFKKKIDNYIVSDEYVSIAEFKQIKKENRRLNNLRIQQSIIKIK